VVIHFAGAMTFTIQINLKKKHCSFITTLSLGMHQGSGKPQLNLIIPIAKPSSERQINNRNYHCAMTSGGQR
jgi:hypothetical protein